MEKKFKTIRILTDESLAIIQQGIDEMVDNMPANTTAQTKVKVMLDLVDEWKKQVCVPGYRPLIAFEENLLVFSAEEQELELSDTRTLAGTPCVVFQGESTPLSSLRFLYIPEMYKLIDGKNINEELEDVYVGVDLNDIDDEDEVN